MLNKIIVCSIFAVALQSSIYSQEGYGGPKEEAPKFLDEIAVAKQYGLSITSKELKEHLMVLASDEFEGRETGMAGQKKAAKYISDYFESIGIPPYDGEKYIQEFPLKREKYLSTTCKIGEKDFAFVNDFYFFGSSVNRDIELTELMLCGYGIAMESWNDYKNTNVSGKSVMILMDVPRNKKGDAVKSGEEFNMWAADWRLKVEEAKSRGVKDLILVNQDFESYMSRVKYYLEDPGMSLVGEDEDEENSDFQVLFISPEMAESIVSNSKNKSLKKYKKRIDKQKEAKQSTVSIDFKLDLENVVERFTGENVLAFIEGSDLKDELVVVTAHYDHIGKKGEEINNGADDDGSGTVSALEIAEAFQNAKLEGNGPRRSVLVMTVSGEEKGLLGSRYYSDHPVYPLESTIVDLNIDMIGRVDEAHADNQYYIYLIGSDKLSTDLHKISEQTNKVYSNLELDYTYNDPEDPNKFYYRSDHYNFAKHGIPVIFYFSGVHEDYHKPTDTPDKILYDKLEKVARLVFYTAWELANRDEAPRVDVENVFED